MAGGGGVGGFLKGSEHLEAGGEHIYALPKYSLYTLMVPRISRFRTVPRVEA